MAHIPRIYVPGRLGPGSIVLDAEEARRLTSVMRIRQGDEFRVFGGDGREFRATVTGTAKGSLHATVGELVRQQAAEQLVIEAWIGLVRPNRFDWAIEKCVEAGADVIRPLVSEHTARGDGGSNARADRWTRIAVEAAEQCGRLHMAIVEPPCRFDDLVRHHHGALVVGHPGGRDWADTAPLVPGEGRLALAIGPEGGFSDEEVALAQAHGALVTSFGPNVFRTETAALVAVALARAVAGSRWPVARGQVS